MGRSFTPTHVIEFTYEDGHKDELKPIWRRKAYGAPTAENLAAVVKRYNESFQEGGVNYYAGLSVVIVAAKVVNQIRGGTQAEWVDFNHKAKIDCAARALQVKEGATYA